ncbi:hypothetical protein [Xanthomarina gelatinilytica]|jgi:hypothetical protein
MKSIKIKTIKKQMVLKMACVALALASRIIACTGYEIYKKKNFHF